MVLLMLAQNGAVNPEEIYFAAYVLFALCFCVLIFAIRQMFK